jgi:hypothetical protein
MSQMQPFSLLFVGFVATTVYLLIVNQDVDGSAMGVMPGFSTASAGDNFKTSIYFPCGFFYPKDLITSFQPLTSADRTLYGYQYQ